MKKRPLCYVCLVFLLIKSVLLLLTGGQSGGLSADSIFQEEKEKEVILQGQVYQKTSTSKMQILYLKNNSINSQNESFYESKIIVYDKTFQNIAIGKTVKLRGKANVFETAHNPGNFDQRQYYAKQNIYGMVWGEQIMEVSGKTNRLMNSLYSLKQAWKEKLTETMGEKNGAVLSAILLSEKKEMDAEIKELYQKNGICFGNFRTSYIFYWTECVSDFSKSRKSLFCCRDRIWYTAFSVCLNDRFICVSDTCCDYAFTSHWCRYDRKSL